MIPLLVILSPIALIYSLAILPSGVASIAASMVARKPYFTAIAFIAGKFTPSFIFGLLIAIGLDTAFDRISVWFSDFWRNPSVLAVLLQLLIGAVMVVFGYRLSQSKPELPDAESTPAMTPAAAFTVGAGLTSVGLPGNLFYFAAIDQILRADLSIPGIVTAVLYYNLLVLAPLMLIVLSRRLVGARADPLFSAVADFFRRRGKSLLFYGMLGIGALMVVDAIGWFIGFPLLPGYIR